MPFQNQKTLLQKIVSEPFFKLGSQNDVVLPMASSWAIEVVILVKDALSAAGSPCCCSCVGAPGLSAEIHQQASRSIVTYRTFLLLLDEGEGQGALLGVGDHHCCSYALDPGTRTTTADYLVEVVQKSR